MPPPTIRTSKSGMRMKCRKSNCFSLLHFHHCLSAHIHKNNDPIPAPSSAVIESENNSISALRAEDLFRARRHDVSISRVSAPIGFAFSRAGENLLTQAIEASDRVCFLEQIHLHTSTRRSVQKSGLKSTFLTRREGREPGGLASIRIGNLIDELSLFFHSSPVESNQVQAVCDMPEHFFPSIALIKRVFRFLRIRLVIISLMNENCMSAGERGWRAAPSGRKLEMEYSSSPSTRCHHIVRASRVM